MTTTADPKAQSLPDQRRHAVRGRQTLANHSLLLVLLAVIATFSAVNPSVFATWANAQTIMSTTATTALLALAAMLPLMTGQFDISVAFQFGLSQSLAAGLVAKQQLPAPLMIVAVLIIGGLIGLANGLLVTRLKLISFIATLATGILVLGATQWYSGDLTIAGTYPSWFLSLGRGALAGIPVPFIFVVLASAGIWIAQEYTTWGRHADAAGGNALAARLSGVPVDRVTVQAFVQTGVLCAFAGVLSVSILGASSPVVGLGSLLPAFAGAFLGSTSVRPGRFNAPGTLIAIYLVAVGINGLRQLGAQSYVEQLFYGSALLIAVIAGQLARGENR